MLTFLLFHYISSMNMMVLVGFVKWPFRFPGYRREKVLKWLQWFTPGIPFVFLVSSPALCFPAIFLPFSLQPRGPVSLESERDGMPAVNNRGTYIVNKKFRFFPAFFRCLTANSLFLPWIIFYIPRPVPCLGWSGLSAPK